MTSIQILAQGAAAWGKTEGIVTAGAVGIPVTLQCSRDWAGLRKIIKFRCGEVEYQFEVVEGTAITVPWTVCWKDGGWKLPWMAGTAPEHCAFPPIGCAVQWYSPPARRGRNRLRRHSS